LARTSTDRTAGARELDCRTAARRRLLFRDPVRPYADSPYEDETVRYVAEARNSGLEATIKIETCADDGLAGFLHELAEDFRGWAETWEWRSLHHYQQLRIEATHDRLGHVKLLFRREPGTTGLPAFRQLPLRW
jgi:hypothetical protein